MSPLAARSELWDGAPPVYITVGWEGMQDETEVFARRVYAAGAAVVFKGLEGMPHCAAMSPWNKAGQHAFEGWGQFCRQAVTEEGIKRTGKGTWLDKFGVLKETELSRLGMRGEAGLRHDRKEDLDDAMVDILMAKARAWRVKEEDDARWKWRKSVNNKATA